MEDNELMPDLEWLPALLLQVELRVGSSLILPFPEFQLIPDQFQNLVT